MVTVLLSWRSSTGGDVHVVGGGLVEAAVEQQHAQPALLLTSQRREPYAARSHPGALALDEGEDLEYAVVDDPVEPFTLGQGRGLRERPIALPHRREQQIHEHADAGAEKREHDYPAPQGRLERRGHQNEDPSDDRARDRAGHDAVRHGHNQRRADRPVCGKCQVVVREDGRPEDGRRQGHEGDSDDEIGDKERLAARGGTGVRQCGQGRPGHHPDQGGDQQPAMSNFVPAEGVDDEGMHAQRDAQPVEDPEQWTQQDLGGRRVPPGDPDRLHPHQVSVAGAGSLGICMARSELLYTGTYSCPVSSWMAVMTESVTSR
jgi:hypothetical protein